MISNLAVVIPAYKVTFFDEALNSIASQLNKNFTVYIGDDNSKDDLLSVVRKYESIINIVFKRFEKNVGLKSVVKHWERCIALTQGEEWIWLFSDDDLMSVDCVELFFAAVEKTKAEHEVYRFNCCIIDGGGKLITEQSQYPTIQTSAQFLLSRLSYQFHSYIVNCIFSRSVYERNNGFIDITAAWGSDDATWILFGQKKNIYTLDNGLVKWRQSNVNISGNRTNIINRSLKYKGMEQFIAWTYKWAKQNKIKVDTAVVIRWYWTMLNSIGFKARRWPYLKSKVFRKFFWRTHLAYQLKLLIKGL